MRQSEVARIDFRRYPILLGHPLGGELAEFVIDQGQELLGSRGVAMFDGV